MRTRGASSALTVVLLHATAKLAACKRQTSAAIAEYDHFLNDFMSQSHTARCNRALGRSVVFDVGSNAGQFISNDLKLNRALSRRHCNSTHRFTAFLFEPQRKWLSALTHLVNELSAKHSQSLDIALMPFAAWTHNTTMRFQTSKNSQEARIVTANASATPDAGTMGAARASYDVEAIDFADFVLRTLRPSDAPVLLKIDIESAEYSLVPRLLTTGVLCLPSHLIVEWHLRHASDSDRLACLALKLALPLMLKRGCKTPPQLLQEEFRAMNAGAQVPGLLEEAMVHVKPGKYTLQGQMPKWLTNYTLDVSKNRFRHEGVTQINGLRR